MPALGKAQLGASTFCASAYPNDKCGANGLPLTPNSIKILGRFQSLKKIEHPRLCKYINLYRSKHERIIVVAEYYTKNLATEQKIDNLRCWEDLVPLAYGVLDGLSHMNEHGLVHRNLSPQNILFDSEEQVKLSKYGRYYMTAYGADVSFPIGKPQYMAPEVISQGPVQLDDYSLDPNHVPSGPKVDVWSLGVILLETWLKSTLWPTLTLQQVMYKIVGFLRIDCHPIDIIAKDHAAEERLKELPEDMIDLIRKCLTVCPTSRPSPKELLRHQLFIDLVHQQAPVQNGFDMFSVELRCKDLEISALEEEALLTGEGTDYLAERSFDEVYYLWQLAGGDLEMTLKKAGLIKGRPPITALANFVIEDGEVFGQERDLGVLLDDTVVVLSQDQLRQRLRNIDEAAYYPLLEDESSSVQGTALPTSPSTGDLTDTATLPIVIKEKDIEYQFHRLMLYARLLKAYPYKRAHIWKEARVDIPPLLRAPVWAALLEVEGDVHGLYDGIDKETPTPTDRQIEVDIPRCHQYSELLSSPAGHAKFKRVLKAWVVSHPEYVYWQGLDSLCAPFLYLNFNDEAVAFSCLDAFIPKYLHKFFLKDNSKVIQEYLAVFSHLIAFHEPELSNHLDGIGFIPDLYAIPWFLTMYARKYEPYAWCICRYFMNYTSVQQLFDFHSDLFHFNFVIYNVFPLHKIFHLWDTLLLGNSSFPLCIGVAILQQLKDQLMNYGFNECILLFSDMPEIDIERCVRDSIKIFCSTPKSTTYRQHARPAKKTNDDKTKRSSALPTYNQDYSDQQASELAMDPLTLEELRSSKCPRISAEDLIDLCELRGPSPTRSPTKKGRSAKPRLLVVDTRSQEEYMRGAIPGSLNIPFSSAFGPEGELVATPAVQVLNQHKHQVKVIVGSRGKNASNFANTLVQQGYTKVCTLHKGIDVLRSTGLLLVPPPEL